MQTNIKKEAKCASPIFLHPLLPYIQLQYSRYVAQLFLWTTSSQLQSLRKKIHFIGHVQSKFSKNNAISLLNHRRFLFLRSMLQFFFLVETFFGRLKEEASKLYVLLVSKLSSRELIARSRASSHRHVYGTASEVFRGSSSFLDSCCDAKPEVRDACASHPFVSTRGFLLIRSKNLGYIPSSMQQQYLYVVFSGD